MPEQCQPDVTPAVEDDITSDVRSDMNTKWLTYDELAAALRIAAGSARRLVARNKQWPRKPGNDGRVRIGVPVSSGERGRGDCLEPGRHSARG
jgi:class 3 adenylate cyclase